MWYTVGQAGAAPAAISIMKEPAMLTRLLLALLALAVAVFGFTVAGCRGAMYGPPEGYTNTEPSQVSSDTNTQKL